MSQNKRQYCLVGGGEIVRVRGKPIVSKPCERPPPLPSRYANWKQGYSFAEIFRNHPKLGENQELDMTKPNYTWPDSQVARILVTYPVVEKKQ